MTVREPTFAFPGGRRTANAPRLKWLRAGSPDENDSGLSLDCKQSAEEAQHRIVNFLGWTRRIPR
jgi:hypothetical protein